MRLLIMCALATLIFGCAGTMNCEKRGDIEFAKHPENKPRPAALVLAWCEDGAKRQWVCEEAVFTEHAETGERTVHCNGRLVFRGRVVKKVPTTSDALGTP